MIGTNAIKIKVHAGEEVFGILNSLPLPLVCEMLGHAGYDFVVIDTEHQLVPAAVLDHAIRTAECAGIAPFVRVPLDDKAMIPRLLDAGAMGIVIPRVSTVAQARAAISAVRFPPIGQRGITGGRNTGFGALSLDDYMALANSEVMLILMIENPEGLAALPEILALPGVDMVLEGALDLSIAMGYGANVQHKAVQSALRTMANHCADAGVPFCAIPRQVDQLDAWRNAGVNAFLAGEDRGMVFRALQSHLHILKTRR